MGSAGIASWIAHLVFWGLIAWGLASGDLGKRIAVSFVTLWFAVPFALAYVPYGPSLFSSVVAIFDIVLVFTIFKGDLRLT